MIIFDPYFAMYRHLATLAGGMSVLVDTYPDFRIDAGRVEAVMTARTKCVVVNTPVNPTGSRWPRPTRCAPLPSFAARRDVLLISDEVYRAFCYDRPFATPARWNDDVLVVDGFSKAYGMTGWRLGFAHGPSRLIQEMAKLQQFSFVCAPSMAQYGGVAALEVDLTAQIDAYRRKRDMVVDALRDHFELAFPEGAFYAFPHAPWGTGSEFVAEAIRNNLLIIPGNVFSDRDTHFRISYAVDDATLRRGLDVLRRLGAKTARLSRPHERLVSRWRTPRISLPARVQSVSIRSGLPAARRRELGDERAYARACARPAPGPRLVERGLAGEECLGDRAKGREILPTDRSHPARAPSPRSDRPGGRTSGCDWGRFR